MIRAKNYETASKFVKVMPRNTVASFFRTRCMYYVVTCIPGRYCFQCAHRIARNPTAKTNDQQKGCSITE